MTLLGLDINFCIFYYVVLLVRCALVSYGVFVVVVILRKTILKNNVFLKGTVWALFIPVLFAGKMKVFDESRIGMVFSNYLRIIGIKYVWACWLYIGIVFLSAGLLFYKRRKLNKLVADMRTGKVNGTSVYVSDIPVTPFTVGVLRPKIVLPEIMLKEYDGQELQTILLHEKIHIRLGHLLLYLLWDILRVLLWINPLLTVGTRYFREDMEEICDWITIQNSQGTAYTYGQMLLKSMRILQTECKNFNMFPAFAGDQGYRNMRQRVIRIAGYKPYKQIGVIGILIAVIFCVAGFILGINTVSYGRNIKDVHVLVYGYKNGDVTFIDNSNELCRMITYDDNYVYVDSEAFDRFMHENNVDGDIYIVFGGFQKLPGIGGFGNACLYENDEKENAVQIPYENNMNDWFIKLYKML